ncbi:adhesion G protein-coupled receptor F5-like [Hemiscyllium ocellatum]|uniref:adhesion G protein-coupled receptor F5-like n=1 Tax=Hemiscyllium ocellatum TaxID=170820 RepID=UPI002965FDB2|nr:adhesion G protein-coupled receptor F5-like [Hemiscyllium ocellatum]
MKCTLKLKKNENLPKSLVRCYYRSHTTSNECHILCHDPVYGLAKSGQAAIKECPKNETGCMKKKCENGKYLSEENFCVLAEIKNMLESTKNKTELAKNLPGLVQQLANISTNQVITEPGNLITTVDILTAFSSVTNVSVNQPIMQDFLVTVNTIIDQSALSSWKTVAQLNISSQLLMSIEQFTTLFSSTEETFNITKPNVQLKGVKINSNSHKDYKINFSDFKYKNRSSSNIVNIDEKELSKLPNGSLVIGVAYATLTDILGTPNNSTEKLNSLVATITAESSSINIEIVSSLLNNTLYRDSAKCVFWDFAQNDGGGWSSSGCRPETNGGNIICKCDHLTSFSSLMSPFARKEDKYLKIISQITTGLSVGCLIIGLIIEAVVWKQVTKTKTSQARHIMMLNIILSLLIVYVLFTMAEYLKGNTTVCIVTIFLMKFFQLSLFFWMFTLALLLLYHLIFLFKDFSKTTILIMSFALGYLCPLIISISTFAFGFSQNHYIQNGKCWLNTEETYLHFLYIVPILSIIAINIFITFLTIFKILRPTVGEKTINSTKDSNIVKQICRSVVILSSVLGLTWALGFGFLDKHSSDILDYAFDILSGLQGLCILIFGILMDSKVQEALRQKFVPSSNSSQKTKLVTSTTSNTY